MGIQGWLLGIQIWLKLTLGECLEIDEVKG